MEKFFIDIHNRREDIPTNVLQYLIKDTGLLFVIQKWLPVENRYGAITESYIKQNNLNEKQIASQVIEQLRAVKTDVVIKNGVMTLSKGRGTYTKDGDFGASVLMYPGELKRAANILAPDSAKPIVVLPLTRNQIAIEIATRTIEEYNDMIKEINSKQDPSNIIDEHCYMIDRRTGRLFYPRWAREIW